MNRRILLIISLFASGFMASAQIITIDPPFPTADEPATVYFNAIGTALESYTGSIYAHTGVTVNGEQWQNVIGNWNVNSSQPRLTNIEADLYKLEITPSIREFYSVDQTSSITEMSFVFRSSDSQLQTSPDIFYDVYEPEIAVIITLPEISPVIVQLNDIVHVEWSINMADSTFLYLEDQLIFADTGSSFSYDIPVTDYGMKEVTAIAKSESASVTDQFVYFARREVTVEELPSGIKDGVNYMDNSTVVLCLYAPEKEYVFAWGDYCNWELSDEVYMKRTPDGARYWVEISGLTPQQQYVFQYLIDGEIRVGDMYCEQVSDPWNDQYISSATYPNLPVYPYDKTELIASVLQTAQPAYEWQVEDFTPPEKTDLVIYELLVRDFTAAHDFKTLKDTLDYLLRLGVNAIELMPTNEFEGNSSWGYNPNYYFAPDKYYGPRNDFKAFIDACHENGIAVFIDLVLNHAYGSCPFVMMYWDSENNQPAENNPWFNQEHNFLNPDAHWGYDFNHESPQTQALVDSINSYWMSEYKVDGFRFDFTKGFSNTIHGSEDPWGSNYDADRVRLLKRMTDEIWERNPDAFVSFEHLAVNTEEKELADYGILLWGNLNSSYNEGTMGYNENGKSDFSGISYQKRNWNEPNLVGYMESHDEQRLMFKNETFGNSNGEYDIKDTITGLKRQELAANFFFTVPGPKLFWEFGERGYDVSIDFNGRVGEKPPRWYYLEDWNRRNLMYTYTSLIDLKKSLDVFETTDFELDVRWAMKKIKLTSPEMSVVVLGNFHIGPAEIDPDFYFTGTWYDYWTGDSLEVSDLNEKIMLQAGEYRLYTNKKLTTPAFVDVEEHIIDNQFIKLGLNPNPAKTQLYVIIENDRQLSDADIYFYDMIGKKVKELKNVQLSNGLNQITADVKSLKKGIYFVRVESGSQSIIEKLIIQ
ncbi:MAG: alpha-amylase [Marinilabiliales bacterium]|nr:MAG: alpha-amylase [Marinilabiliales bacterium]